MVLEKILPIEVVRKIYSYDNTYREYYEENVLNLIERSWAIKWIDREKGHYGLDYSHYGILSMNAEVERPPYESSLTANPTRAYYLT